MAGGAGRGLGAFSKIKGVSQLQGARQESTQLLTELCWNTVRERSRRNRKGR